MWACPALVRSGQTLVLENLSLRQQLATLAQRRRRPRLTSADRRFWVALRAGRSDWAAALVIVKPSRYRGVPANGNASRSRWLTRVAHGALPI